MIDLPPHLLRSLVAVADAQGYTAGGARLFLAQPTIHQHIRQLERITGVALVQQVGKKVRLTSQGRLVYEYAREESRRSDGLRRALIDDATLASGELAAAAATTAGEFLVPRICAGFHNEFPGVRISTAVINDPLSVDRAVARGDADVGFHSKPNPMPGVIKQPLLEEQLVGIAPPGHPLLRSSAPIAPRELEGLPMVLFGNAGRDNRGSIPDLIPFTRLVNDWFDEAGVEPSMVFATTSHEGIKTAVRAGMGIAIVSRLAVRANDHSLGIFQLEGAPRRSFVLVRREGGWYSSALQVFAKYALGSAWRDEGAGF